MDVRPRLYDCVLMKGLKGERGEEGPIGLPVSGSHVT